MSKHIQHLCEHGHGAIVERVLAAGLSQQEVERRLMNLSGVLDRLLKEGAGVVSAAVIPEILQAVADDNAADMLWPLFRHKVPLH